MNIRTLKLPDVEKAAALLVACFPLEEDFCRRDLLTSFPEAWPLGNYGYCQNFIAALCRMAITMYAHEEKKIRTGIYNAVQTLLKKKKIVRVPNGYQLAP